MPFSTALTQRLGTAHPIIQAPMAGGATTLDLVAAVCEAGALGVVAAAYAPPAQTAELCHTLRARTRRPFGINLFAPVLTPDAPPAEVERAVARLD